MGHSFCTGLAVLGGRMIAQKISVRTGKMLFFYNKKIDIIKKILESYNLDIYKYKLNINI